MIWYKIPKKNILSMKEDGNGTVHMKVSMPKNKTFSEYFMTHKIPEIKQLTKGEILTGVLIAVMICLLLISISLLMILNMIKQRSLHAIIPTIIFMGMAMIMIRRLFPYLIDKVRTWLNKKN